MTVPSAAQELTSAHPDFVFGYWGAAMTNNELLWNTESPAKSLALLQVCT